MNYELSEIEYVEAIVISGYKWVRTFNILLII